MKYKDRARVIQVENTSDKIFISVYGRYCVLQAAER